MTHNELYHYGIKRRSGRYPWGSGERPFQALKEKRAAKKAERKERITNELNELRSKEGKKKYPHRLNTTEALQIDIEQRVYEKLFGYEEGRTINKRKIFQTEDQKRDKFAENVAKKITKQQEKKAKKGEQTIHDIVRGELGKQSLAEASRNATHQLMIQQQIHRQMMNEVNRQIQQQIHQQINQQIQNQIHQQMMNQHTMW